MAVIHEQNQFKAEAERAFELVKEALFSEETNPKIYFYDRENLGPLISTLEMARFADVAEALAPAFVRRRP